MSKKQTRRTISISGATYSRLKIYAQSNNKSMSGIVEKLIKEFLASEERRAKIADGNRRMTEAQTHRKPLSHHQF